MGYASLESPSLLAFSNYLLYWFNVENLMKFRDLRFQLIVSFDLSALDDSVLMTEGYNLIRSQGY